MNAEELKLITDAITTLGVQGKEAFIWFLVIKYGFQYLLHLILWPSALLTVYKIAKLMNGGGEYEQFMLALRRITHPHRGGVLTRSECIDIQASVAAMFAVQK